MEPPTATLIDRTPAPRPRELFALLAIIAIADVGLYQSDGGVGRAIVFAGVPAVVAIATTPRRSPRLVAIAVLLGLVAVRSLWQSSIGVTALGLVTLLPFAIALRSSHTYIPELAASALGSLTGVLRSLRAFTAIARALRPSRAIYIPVGLVIVFAAIFAAANPAIQTWLADAMSIFDGTWSPSPVRLVFWLASTLAALALLRPALRTIARLDARLGIVEASEPTTDAPTPAHLLVARNGMIGLNLLFLAYNALDAIYLWAGRTPSGITFTEYAHAGTVWLTIAFVLSTIVLGALFRGPIEHHPDGRLARRLAFAWAGQNLILAAGTFRRITMYVAYSGLTELRIVGICGTALTILGLAIIVYKIARRRTMLWVLRRQLDALVLVIAAFLLAPTDELAMRYNAARIADAQYRPLLHLYEQPIRDEAIPALLTLLDHPDPVVREGVAVLIAAHPLPAAPSWLDLELAHVRAARAVDAAAAKLAHAMPIDRDAATARLRGVAYGVNEEVERRGDDAPYDWHVRHYAPR